MMMMAWLVMPSSHSAINDASLVSSYDAVASNLATAQADAATLLKLLKTRHLMPSQKLKMQLLWLCRQSRQWRCLSPLNLRQMKVTLRHLLSAVNIAQCAQAATAKANLTSADALRAKLIRCQLLPSVHTLMMLPQLKQ